MNDGPAPTPEQLEANLKALQSCEYGPSGTGGNQYCIHCGRGIYGYILEDALTSTSKKYNRIFTCSERRIRLVHEQ